MIGKRGRSLGGEVGRDDRRPAPGEPDVPGLRQLDLRGFQGGAQPAPGARLPPARGALCGARGPLPGDRPALGGERGGRPRPAGDRDLPRGDRALPAGDAEAELPGPARRPVRLAPAAGPGGGRRARRDPGGRAGGRPTAARVGRATRRREGLVPPRRQRRPRRVLPAPARARPVRGREHRRTEGRPGGRGGGVARRRSSACGPSSSVRSTGSDGRRTTPAGRSTSPRRPSTRSCEAPSRCRTHASTSSASSARSRPPRADRWPSGCRRMAARGPSSTARRPTPASCSTSMPTTASSSSRKAGFDRCSAPTSPTTRRPGRAPPSRPTTSASCRRPSRRAWSCSRTTTRPHTLCLDAWRSLARVILRQLDQLEALEETTREIAGHEAFGAERSRHFVGRAAPLEAISAYLAGDEAQPLAVLGDPGSGKSALLAKAAERARAAHPGADDRRPLHRGDPGLRPTGGRCSARSAGRSRGRTARTNRRSRPSTTTSRSSSAGGSPSRPRRSRSSCSSTRSTSSARPTRRAA